LGPDEVIGDRTWGGRLRIIGQQVGAVVRLDANGVGFMTVR
jgi:hypothetical protein